MRTHIHTYTYTSHTHPTDKHIHTCAYKITSRDTYTITYTPSHTFIRTESHAHTHTQIQITITHTYTCVCAETLTHIHSTPTHKSKHRHDVSIHILNPSFSASHIGIMSPLCVWAYSVRRLEVGPCLHERLGGLRVPFSCGQTESGVRVLHDRVHTGGTGENNTRRESGHRRSVAGDMGRLWGSG